MYFPLPSFSMAVMTSGSSRTMPFIFSFFSASWWIFFFRCAAVSGNQGPVGGHIQEPRSLKGAAFNEGGQIDEHLQVHAVEHVGELELLDAGLIVHNAHIGLPVELGQIHPVDFAADGHRSLFCGNPQGRELGAVLQLQLKVAGGKAALGQLLSNVADDDTGGIRQPPQLEPEPERCGFPRRPYSSGRIRQ